MAFSLIELLSVAHKIVHYDLVTSVALALFCTLLFVFLLCSLVHKMFYVYFELLDDRIPRTWWGTLILATWFILTLVLALTFIHYYWMLVDFLM